MRYPPQNRFWRIAGLLVLALAGAVPVRALPLEHITVCLGYAPRALIDAFAARPESRQGRQVLTLFKADHLAPFEEQSLEGVRTLKEQYDRMIVEPLTR